MRQRILTFLKTALLTMLVGHLVVIGVTYGVLAAEALFIECENCESTYQLKHDMSERHYQPKYCTFCGEELTEYYDPNQRELFDDEDIDDGTDDWETDEV